MEASVLQNSPSWGRCLGSVAGSRLLKTKAQVNTGAAQDPHTAATSPTHLWCPRPSWPRKACSSLSGKGWSEGWPFSLPGLGRGPCACCIPPPPPSPGSAASTCFHHNVQGIRGHGAQCSKSQSLAGEQGGPASPQATCMNLVPGSTFPRLQFPFVSCQDCLNDCKGQAAAGVSSFSLSLG